jgi:hypothetical protein
MASLGYWPKDGYEQCTENHHVKKGECVDLQEDCIFSGYFLGNGSTIDTDMFRHFKINELKTRYPELWYILPETIRIINSLK